jgi:hypothetical protein
VRRAAKRKTLYIISSGEANLRHVCSAHHETRVFLAVSAREASPSLASEFGMHFRPSSLLTDSCCAEFHIPANDSDQSDLGYILAAI